MWSFVSLIFFTLYFPLLCKASNALFQRQWSDKKCLKEAESCSTVPQFHVHVANMTPRHVLTCCVYAAEKESLQILRCVERRKKANKKSADNNVRLVQRDDKLHSLLARRLDEAKCCGSKRTRENLSPVTGSRQWSCCCCAPSSRVVRDQIEFHFDIRSASRIIRNREWASRKRVENRSWKKLQDCRDVCYWMEFFMLRFPPSSANSSSIGISDDALSPPFLMLFFNQV